MLDTSALIGLHEAHPEVATYLAVLLGRFDDGSSLRTHEVVLGELWAGVLAIGELDDPSNPRVAALESTAELEIETIEEADAELYAKITAATNRAMSHNDRWICAAAIRTRSVLVTQDAGMHTQLNRYFASLDLLDALTSAIRVEYVPRDPAALAEQLAGVAVQKFELPGIISDLLARLDPRETEVLKLRFGLDRGEPRTLQEVADHFGLKPERIAQIEKRAIGKLREPQN